jgi:hypothetical protein
MITRTYNRVINGTLALAFGRYLETWIFEVNIDAQSHHRGVRLLVVKSKQLFITQPQGINVRENWRGNQEWRIHAKTQATLDTRHRQHWTQDTGNTGHKTEATLDTRQRMKTSKTKNTTQKTKIWTTKILGVNPSVCEVRAVRIWTPLSTECR